jgi:hypothetical protein
MWFPIAFIQNSECAATVNVNQRFLVCDDSWNLAFRHRRQWCASAVYYSLLAYCREANGGLANSREANGHLGYSREGNGHLANSREANYRLANSPEVNGRLANSPEVNGDLGYSREVNGDLGYSREVNGDLGYSREVNRDLGYSREVNGDLGYSREANCRLANSREDSGHLGYSREVNGRLANSRSQRSRRLLSRRQRSLRLLTRSQRSCVSRFFDYRIFHCVRHSIVFLNLYGENDVTWVYRPRMIHKWRPFGGKRTGKGNRSTRRKPAPVPLHQPQNPHPVTGDGPRTDALEKRPLTAWDIVQPSLGLTL